MDITYVTLLLGESFEENVEYIDKLLELEINLFCCVTEGIKNRLTHLARNNLTFETITYGSSDTDSLKYDCLLLSMDKLGDGNYIWIDPCVLKYTDDMHSIMKLKVGKRVKFMIKDYIGEKEVSEQDFIAKRRHKCETKLFGGPARLMKALCYLVKASIEENLYYDITGNDEDHIARIYKKYPTMFKPYYGNTNEIVSNFTRKNRTVETAREILRKSLCKNDACEIETITNYIVRSFNDKELENIIRITRN